MGQGVHTVALQVAAQELGIDPSRIDVIVDTTRELGFGQTTGSRGTLMAAGSVQQACLAALAGGCATGGRLRGRAPRRLDPAPRRPGPSEPHDPRRVRLRRADGRSIDRDDRAGSSASSPSTTSARPSTRCCARARSRAACTWASATRCQRGLPGRPRDRLPHQHDAALARHPAREGRAARSTCSSSRCPQPRSPYGIKGVGEIGLVPTAPAVAAALHDLDGTWRNVLPMRRGSDDAD